MIELGSKSLFHDAKLCPSAQQRQQSYLRGRSSSNHSNGCPVISTCSVLEFVWERHWTLPCPNMTVCLYEWDYIKNMLNRLKYLTKRTLECVWPRWMRDIIKNWIQYVKSVLWMVTNCNHSKKNTQVVLFFLKKNLNKSWWFVYFQV